MSPAVATSVRRGLTFFTLALTAGILFALLFMPGCAEDTSIRTYRVAKTETRSNAATGSSQSVASAQEQIMLGAIVPHQDSAWFFKLTGAPEIVERNREPFRDIVESVEFPSTGDPRWKLAEGWDEQRFGSGMTYANLNRAEDGLTATVTRLAFPGEQAWRSYVEDNINRWRKQLSLAEQSWEDMQREIEEVPELSQGSAKAYFVSLSGRGSGSMAAPFMNQMRAAPAGPSREQEVSDNNSAEATGPHAADQTASAADKGLTYDRPDEWEELPATGMRRAAFALSHEDTTGEVTVIAAGGTIEANIGIWLGQVGLEATEESKQAVLEKAETLEVNNIQAKLYTIEGESAEAGPATTILIADVPWKSEESLFVKLKGDESLVAAHRQRFVDFVKSIQW